MIAPEEMKELILNSTEPFLIKNVLLKSTLLSWDLNKWKTVLKNEQLEFRKGANSYTKNPQWERTTKIVKGSFDDFLKVARSRNSPEWLYFDYKYLKDWLKNVEQLRSNFDIGLDKLGFPNLNCNDCTIWIGSKGAHTPCHQDTYGCNLIFQIYGQKQWIICPPDEDLNPVRIPYEESSIYSKLNFFSPTLSDFQNVKNARKIVLKPGDILFLPHKWWHYVENLETAISINVWVPLPVDDKERLDESLVQLFIKQFCNKESVNEEVMKKILNPNTEKDFVDTSVENVVETIDFCKIIYKENKLQKVEQTANTFQEYFSNNLIEKIPPLLQTEFYDFIMQQSIRFAKSSKAELKNDEAFDKMASLINAITHPSVINLIREKLVNE